MTRCNNLLHKLRTVTVTTKRFRAGRRTDRQPTTAMAAEPIKLGLKLGGDLTPGGMRRSVRTPRRHGRRFQIVSLGSQEPTSLISILRALPDWADRVKERGVRRERSLYNHEKWVEHRSSLRHVRHLVSSLSSRVILSLVPPVTAFTAFAAAIAGYNSAVDAGWLPEWFPILSASSLPYQLTAPALALLLVFRTEASYSRFEEGRQAWTKVIASTNDLAREVVAIGGRNTRDDSSLMEALLGYIVAFPVSLKCHLIYGSDIAKDLKDRLDRDDLATILKSKHRPRCVIEFISQSLRFLNIEDSERYKLDSKLSCFHEGISICEQLMGIPIPLSYTRLTSRFLVLWHLTLPVILWDDCRWVVVPATFVSAASLFCIEEVGVLIEEPFPMLALDELCDQVRRNVDEAIKSRGVIRDRIEGKLKGKLQEKWQNGRPQG